MDRIRQALDRARLERAQLAAMRLETLLPLDPCEAPPLEALDLPLPDPCGDVPVLEPHAVPLLPLQEAPADPQPSDLEQREQPIQVETPVDAPSAEPQRAPEPESAPEPELTTHGAANEGGAIEGTVIDSAVIEGDGGAHDSSRAELAVWERPQGERDSLPRPQRNPRQWGYAPLIASLVLAVLITGELARASLVLLRASPAEVHEPLLGRSAPLSARATIDVDHIVAAHLFGEVAAAAGPQDPSQRAPANLLLAGTLAMDDPRHGIAIISNGGRSTAYRVGETVADAELHSVYRDHVILSRRGTLDRAARFTADGRRHVARRGVRFSRRKIARLSHFPPEQRAAVQRAGSSSRRSRRWGEWRFAGGPG